MRVDDGGINGTDCTPLAMAAQSGKTGVMEKLIRHGANVDAIDDEIGPVVNGAILSGNYDAVKMLIARGARLNYPLSDDGSGGVEWTADWPPPLALAALHSDLVMFDTVLEAGAGVLSAEEYEKGLVLSSFSGRAEVVSRLLEHGYTEQAFQTALQAAASEENWDVIRLLLKSSDGLDCDDVFREAAAAAENLEDVLDAIWAHTHHSIDQTILDSCLYIATDREKEKTVESLLGMGADPDAHGEEYVFSFALACFAGILHLQGDVAAATIHILACGGVDGCWAFFRIRGVSPPFLT